MLEKAFNFFFFLNEKSETKYELLACPYKQHCACFILTFWHNSISVNLTTAVLLSDDKTVLNRHDSLREKKENSQAGALFSTKHKSRALKACYEKRSPIT